jgi:hypothetical protein
MLSINVPAAMELSELHGHGQAAKRELEPHLIEQQRNAISSRAWIIRTITCC